LSGKSLVIPTIAIKKNNSGTTCLSSVYFHRFSMEKLILNASNLIYILQIIHQRLKNIISIFKTHFSFSLYCFVLWRSKINCQLLTIIGFIEKVITLSEHDFRFFSIVQGGSAFILDVIIEVIIKRQLFMILLLRLAKVFNNGSDISNQVHTWIIFSLFLFSVIVFGFWCVHRRNEPDVFLLW
jgi:hypothetical protein